MGSSIGLSLQKRKYIYQKKPVFTERGIESSSSEELQTLQVLSLPVARVESIYSAFVLRRWRFCRDFVALAGEQVNADGEEILRFERRRSVPCTPSSPSTTTALPAGAVHPPLAPGLGCAPHPARY